MKFLRGVSVVATALLATLAAACSTSSDPGAISTSPVPPPSAQPTRPAPASLGPASAPTPGPLRPFTLPRAAGGELSLADYLGKQPVSVVFYRGFF